MGNSALVKAEGLKKYFYLKTDYLFSKKLSVRAVDGVDLTIAGGDVFGLAGESGCGKSTLGRLLLRLLEPTAGAVYFMDRRLSDLSGQELRAMRRWMQIIFQDSSASLNPRNDILQILSLPYKIHESYRKDEIESLVLQLLESVGLTPAHDFLHRYPHEFSGGQRERINIARAIALHPKFIVADEPVSALDMSIRGQILNLMKQLQDKFGITWLFISHDLSVLRSMCTRCAIMYVGKIVEMTEVEDLYVTPLHPYTKALLAATPVPDPKIQRSRVKSPLKGEVPTPSDPPRGCRFHPRCVEARTKCKQNEPQLVEVEDGHFVACWLNG